MELTLDEVLQKAVEAHKAGQIQEADRLYTAILQAQPKHPDTNHNMGVLAVSVGKVKESLSFFKTALEANQNINQYWLSYIDALIKEKQFDNAKELLEQAKKYGMVGEKLNTFESQLSSETQPQTVNSANPSEQQLGCLLEHYQTGRYDEAEKLARSLSLQFPCNNFSLKILAGVLKQTGRASEAVLTGKKAVEICPDDAEAHFHLGVTLQQLDRLEEAEASYTQVIALKPDYADAHNNLGFILKKLGRLEEAEARYTKAIALKPDFTLAHFNLGIAQRELGKLDEAEASYKHAVVLKPDYTDVHYNLGNMLKDLGRFDEAHASYTQVITLKPDFAEAYNNLGMTLQELGRFDEAQASVTQAIVLKPDYAEAHYNLGITLAKLDRLDDSEISYMRAIELKPDFAEAHNNLGIIQLLLERLEEAESSYTQAIALKPDLAEAHKNLGETLQKQGRLNEAVCSFQKAFTKRTGIRPVGDSVLAPATSALYFELTNKCNFHCTFCPSDSQTRDIGSMDLELVKRLYEEAAVKKIDTVVNLHLMGEPTLHPKLIEILRFGASKNIKTDLVTNGTTLVGKVVPKILDSLYGTLIASHMTPTQETYHYRGEVKLSWDRYISNIRLLIREYMKRLSKRAVIKNDIVIRVMATQNTESNVIITDTPNKARAILKEWNDFVAEVEQELGMTPFKRKDHNADDLLQENRHNSISYPLQNGIKLVFWRAFTFANTRVSEDFALETPKETAYCPHPFTDVGVLWNGDVTLCCLDHDGELNVGNVRDSSIETVIQSEAARNLRGSMLGHHPLPSVCQTCQAKPVRR